MSHFDGNPFDEESGQNPYSQNGGASSGGVLSKITSFGKSAFSASAADEATAAPSQQELARKEKELKALEESLQRKEQEIVQQEARTGVEHKNFPPFWPLIHHDIRNDIREDCKHVQYAAFWSWMLLYLCLLFNLVGAIASWAAGTFDFLSGCGNFFLALIYLLMGVPLSYFLWYRPLYRAMKTTYAGLSYTMFFIAYAVHVAFCMFATVAPPFLWHGYSFTGFMSAFDIITHGWVVIGIIYFVGAGLFCGESVLSVYVMGWVFARFRGRKT